ncbi:MAG: formimidoylglutamate deiminase [Myxococcaceae bacterium]
MGAVVYQPDFLYANGQLTRGALAVSDDGKVLAAPPPGATTVKLPGRLLLPGLINAHSHAFQRVLRGRTHFVATGREADDFWSWRELMYRAASTLDPDGVYVASRQAFVEMALAGITTVGEFHYLHNQPNGTPYPDVHELARQVIRAARDAGLRIALLRVAYARAGFNVAPNPRQARFIEPDAATFLSRADELAAKNSDPLVTVGLAPHSVRAVPKAWLTAIAAGSNNRVIHAHVAEQPAEITACLAEHNLRPVQLLASTGILGKRTTGVHAIHLDAADIDALARSGTNVCACPSTERDLGDGVIPADQLLRAGVSLSLGSDSQAVIDLLDDARQLEGHLRLVRLKRAVLDPGTGATDGTAKRLLDCATVGGARSLGLDTGTLAPGTPADFCTVALNTPALAGVPEDALLAAAVFAQSKISDVCVQGKLIVRDGVHPLAEKSSADFSALMKTLVNA